VELFQLTVNAHQLCQIVHLAHPDPPAQVDNPDNRGVPVNPVTMELPAKLLLPVHHKTLHANLAQLDLPDQADLMDHQDHLDPTVNQEPQGKVLVKGHLDLPDPLEMQDLMASLVPRVNLVLPVKTELVRLHLPGQKDRVEVPDLQDPQDQMAIQDNQEIKDHQDLPDQMEIQALQVEMDNPERTDQLVCQEATQPIVPVLHVHQSSFTVNRLDSTAILFLCLFCVEKLKKDFVFEKVPK